jgi:hypothetical protein
MNYGEVITAAKAYVDRYDDELAAVIPSFTRVVESKINTALKVAGQSVQATQIWLDENETYYGLPSDFGGMSDIQIVTRGENPVGRTLVYVNPEELLRVMSNPSRGRCYYTLVADQIRIPPPGPDEMIELTYYQMVPPLTELDDSNWLTEKHPETYIFGLCAEMGAFAKDQQVFAGYDGRFKETLFNITQDDAVTRWSGPSLRISLEETVV